MSHAVGVWVRTEDLFLWEGGGGINKGMGERRSFKARAPKARRRRSVA